eukprot:5034075-Prymnesium_polylepis.1
MPRGGNFGGRPESPRDRARGSACAPACRPPAGCRDWAAPREDALRDSATAETPHACVEREPPLRHASHRMQISGTRNGQTPAVVCARSLDWMRAHALETWPRNKSPEEVREKMDTEQVEEQ